MLQDFEILPARSLSPQKTIADALEQIGDRYGAIVTVADDDNRLLGVVSAGDLRKNILNGNGVDTPLNQVMNSEPITITDIDVNNLESFNRVSERIKNLYNLGNMMYALVPVVGKDKKIVGLASLQSLERHLSDLDITVSRKSALVVGGAGFIGSALTRMMIEEGWSVKVLDNFFYGQNSLDRINNDRLSVIRGDAKSIDTIVEAVDGVDAVIYLAELVGDPAVSVAPQTALKTNYLAVTTLANLCAYLNINRFVYTSSCSVYGASENPDALLDEGSVIAPVSLYGKIKLMVEEAVLSAARLPNPSFAPTILRLATAFGYSERCRFDLVVNTFVKEAFTKGRIELFGGNQWRPQVHIKDISQAILKVLDAPLEDVRSQIFNVGSTQNNHTINELGDFIEDLFPDVKLVRNEAKADIRNYRVNCDKIERILGFNAKYSVIDGMAELKAALENGEMGNVEDAKYSNFASARDLELN